MTIVNLRMHADAEHPLSAFTWLATANTENPLTRIPGDFSNHKNPTLKRGTMLYGNTASRRRR